MEIKNTVIKLSVLVMFFSLIVLSGIFAWTEPTTNPPDGNLDLPVNTGNNNQVKTGALGVGGLIVYDDFMTGTLVGNQFATGTLITAAGEIETEGIFPASDTSVIGSSGASWAEIYATDIYFDKGTFNTLDPVYQIDGTKYVTYVTDTVGLKAEAVGELEFSGNSFTVNLSKQEKGSDLWLFNSIVKKNTIVPFVSSQSPVGLYGYIEGDSFIIKTIGDYSGTVKLSYRLIGERIDNTATNNLSDNQNISTYINVDEIK